MKKHTSHADLVRAFSDAFVETKDQLDTANDKIASLESGGYYRKPKKPYPKSVSDNGNAI